MSELSKFINLIIQYGQKLQSTINKKYRPFIRSICNLQQLAKSTDPQKITLTKQFIIFKLGLQSKSTKSIQLSLYYLQKFFGNKFIDLNEPNHCQEFEIDQTTIRKKENPNLKGDMRTELLKLLQPLVHFKSPEINILLLKVYEYLITEPIAPMLIELNLLTPNSELGQKILHNYFSYRFYIYEEVYTFTEKQFRSINPLCIRNPKINQQIEQAFVNHEQLLDLVHKYVGEMVVQVAQIGGKYGLCVICKQPADYYCKITKASLCGAECKKRHLQLAQKQYKMYFQAVHLWDEIKESYELLLQALAKKQSRSLLTVFVTLIEKPNLFMLVKPQFRQLMAKHTTGIVNMALNYKDELSFELTYTMIALLCRYWMVESVSSIEYFFKQCALKLIQDKRPSFKLMIGLFKALAKVFQYGKTTIELYINFDCEFNRTNIIERILFELSKICQDKFSSYMFYNKHEKIALKNGAFTLITLLAKGLNEYRLLYPENIPHVETQILQLKQKKTNLQKFILKFNQHWSQGLKMLFNMNLVGLQSEIQIVEILLSTKGLKKQKIEQMLSSQNGKQYVTVLFDKIINTGPFMGLVQLFRLIPLKKSSLLLKHYSDYVLQKMFSASKDENNQSQQYSVTKWTGFLTTNYTLKDLQKYLYMENIKVDGTLEHVYMKCLETRGEMTMGSHRTFFRHCISRTYVKVFEPQLSLLQIPILFLLETSYPHDKVFELVTELIQICAHASWVALCLKTVDVEGMIRSYNNDKSSKKYTQQDHSLVTGCLKICKLHSQSVHQWPAILQFMNKLYKLINLQPSKKITIQSIISGVVLQQPLKIKQQLTIGMIEEHLLMIGENTVENFANFIIAMIKLAEEELQKENVFFLQKMFEILQHNLAKLLTSMASVMGELEQMVRRIVAHNLTFLQNDDKQTPTKPTIKKSILPQIPHSKPPSSPYSSQILIYMADMLKQLFVKILKHLSLKEQKKTIISQQLTQQNSIIQRSFFKLFSLILECQNKQANDFVMNSISMVIMVYSEFVEETWSFIVDILKQHSKQYRQQVLTILQKVLKEKLRNCEHLQFEIINLAIDLVDEKQTKLSIESIHLMKDFIDLMIKQCQDREKIQGERVEELRRRSKDKNEIIQQEKSKIEQTKNQQQKQEINRGESMNHDNNEGEQQSNEQNKQETTIFESDNMQVIKEDKPHQQSPQPYQQHSSDSSLQLVSHSSPRKIKQYLLLIISNLIEFISYECHEGAIEILFILMKTRLPQSLRIIDKQNPQSSLLFSQQEITIIMGQIYKKLQSLPKQLLSRGQKIMNESLFWSVRNNYHIIVKNLQSSIVGKFSRMSYTAMKCIKTFVSMTNPKKPSDWDPIEQTLVKILANTHLTDILSKGNQQSLNINIQPLIFSNHTIPQSLSTQLQLQQLSNKLIIQRMAVQVLPNDVKIISELNKIYSQTLQFNDNVYLRCLLWRQGLGNDQDTLPDILSLEELISYRIISTYYWSKEYQKIAEFTLNIINRYCQASRKWQYLQSQSQRMQQQANDHTYELFTLCKDYWQRRRQPLKVIINYMLPKLPKICKDYSQKEKLLFGIIQGMKFSEQTTPYVDTIRQMTIVR